MLGYQRNQNCPNSQACLKLRSEMILGAKKNASLDTIQKLAEAFDYQPWQMLAPIAAAGKGFDAELAMQINCLLDISYSDSVLLRKLIHRFWLLSNVRPPSKLRNP